MTIKIEDFKQLSVLYPAQALPAPQAPENSSFEKNLEQKLQGQEQKPVDSSKESAHSSAEQPNKAAGNQASPEKPQTPKTEKVNSDDPAAAEKNIKENVDPENKRARENTQAVENKKLNEIKNLVDGKNQPGLKQTADEMNLRKVIQDLDLLKFKQKMDMAGQVQDKELTAEGKKIHLPEEKVLEKIAGQNSQVQNRPLKTESTSETRNPKSTPSTSSTHDETPKAAESEKSAAKTTIQTEPQGPEVKISDLRQITVDIQSQKDMPQVKFKADPVVPKYPGMERFQEVRARIVNNIDNGIQMLLAKGGENRVDIRLYPPELGQVRIEMVMKDNRVNAIVHTENIVVKEVILNQLDQLRTNIENAGFQVNRFDVDVGDFRQQLEREDFKKQGRKGFLLNNSDQTETVAIPEETPASQHPLRKYLGRSINLLV